MRLSPVCLPLLLAPALFATTAFTLASCSNGYASWRNFCIERDASPSPSNAPPSIVARQRDTAASKPADAAMPPDAAAPHADASAPMPPPPPADVFPISPIPPISDASCRP